MLILVLSNWLTPEPLNSEPKTARPMKDVLGVPESLFMLFDTLVVFDRFFGIIKVITHLKIPENIDDIETEYRKATRVIEELIDVLNAGR